MGIWRDLWGLLTKPPQPLSEQTQIALADAYVAMSTAEQLRCREAIVHLGIGVAPRLPGMILERAAANLARAEMAAERVKGVR